MVHLHPIKAVLLAMKVAVLLSPLFLCSSCTTSQRETPPVLLQAEALLQSHPDSAYAILQPINVSSLDSLDRAHYYYLYTAAADKIGQHISWPEEMQRAADIYAPTLEDNDTKARVYYYAALAHRQNFAYTDAFKNYLLSLTLQDENSPSRMLLFTYLGCYYCLYEQSLFVESLEYVNKMILTSELLKDNYILLWSLHRKAHIYICLDMDESALNCINKYRQLAQIYNFPLPAEFYNSFSNLYTTLALYDKALLYSDSAYIASPLPGDICAIHSNRANIYNVIGKNDSAEYYFHLALEEYDVERRKEIYKALLKIAKTSSVDSIKIQQYADSFKVYSDLTTTQKATIPLQKIETQRKIDSDQKVITNKYRWIISAVIFLFILLIVSILKKGFHLFTKKEKQISTLLSANQELNAQKSEIKEKYDHIIEEQEQEISAAQFEEEILRPAIECFMRTPSYNIIEQILELEWKEKLGTQGQILFRETIDKTFSRVIQVLEKSSGVEKINQNDLIYLILSYMKISPRHIASFVPCETDSLRKKRSRFRKKMVPQYFQIFFPS